MVLRYLYIGGPYFALTLPKNALNRFIKHRETKPLVPDSEPYDV